MAGDSLEDILRLVDSGQLTAEEAIPILAALDEPASEPASETPAQGPGARAGGETLRPDGGGPRTLRIEVTDGGRPVVNLRLPIAVGKLALDRVPGLPTEQVMRVREAMRSGYRGSILEVDDDGDGVRIVLE